MRPDGYVKLSEVLSCGYVAAEVLRFTNFAEFQEMIESKKIPAAVLQSVSSIVRDSKSRGRPALSSGRRDGGAPMQKFGSELQGSTRCQKFRLMRQQQ